MIHRDVKGRGIPKPAPVEVLDWLAAIGEAKRELRLEARALAAALTGSKSTWSRIISGETLPSREMLEALCARKCDAARRTRLTAAWEKAWLGLGPLPQATGGRPAPEGPVCEPGADDGRASVFEEPDRRVPAPTRMAPGSVPDTAPPPVPHGVPRAVPQTVPRAVPGAVPQAARPIVPSAVPAVSPAVPPGPDVLGSSASVTRADGVRSRFRRRVPLVSALFVFVLAATGVLLHFGVLSKGNPAGRAADRPEATRRPTIAPTEINGRSLREGDLGPRVEAAQYLLKARGRRIDTIDGAFDARTTDAVKDYQKAAGLRADGVIGRFTWASLTPLTQDGDQGGVVTAAQVLLRAHGHRVDVHGIFDHATGEAVREFQKAAGLDDDGIVGEKTWRALFLVPSEPVPAARPTGAPSTEVSGSAGTAGR